MQVKKDLLFRFGNWCATVTLAFSGMIVPIGIAQAVAPSITTQSTLSTVVINELVANSGHGVSEYVELYNPTTTAMDLANWTIESASDGIIHTFAAGSTLPAGGFMTQEFSSHLDNEDDAVTLKNALGTTIDQVRYGTGLTSQLPAPSDGLAAGRRADGTTAWYANLTPTQNSANGGSLTLANPSSAQVAAGSQNAVNMINAASKQDVIVTLSAPSTSLATDTVNVDLMDTAGTVKSAQVAASTGAGTVMTPAINTTSGTDLLDGAIQIRTSVMNANGIATMYSLGTAATKDTVAPTNKPTGASISAITGMNPANMINAANKAAVTVDVTLPVTALSSDTVMVTLSDGTHLISKTVPALSGAGTVHITGIDASSLLDGTVTIEAALTDVTGNSTGFFSGPDAEKDTVLPTGTLIINDGATIMTSTSVLLHLTATDTGSGVTQMRIANTGDFAGSSFEPFASTKTWELVAGEGSRTVYVQLTDAAGNVSETIRTTVSLKKAVDTLKLVSLVSGTQTIRELPVEATLTTTSPVQVTVATYPTNPGTALPTGTTGFGRFFEITAQESGKITLPIAVRYYYTLDELRLAGIASETQLQGIGVFDSATQTWKLLGSTGVSTTDITVSGQQFAGFIFGTSSTLAPMIGFADTLAPNAPTAVTAKTGDGFVELSWNAVPDAASYVVRFRPTGNMNTPFISVILSSVTTTTKLVGLTNGTQYEFGVATRDQLGNTSNFTNVQATPAVPQVVTPSQPTTATTGRVFAPGAKADSGTGSVVKPTPTKSPTPTKTTESPTPTATPTQTPEERAKDLSRVLVTLAILIIAVGAGTLGYYAYQWFAGRPDGVSGPTGSQPPTTSEVKTPPPAPPTTPPTGTPPASTDHKPGSVGQGGPVEPPKSDPPTSGPDTPKPPTEGRW